MYVSPVGIEMSLALGFVYRYDLFICSYYRAVHRPMYRQKQARENENIALFACCRLSCLFLNLLYLCLFNALMWSPPESKEVE